MTRCDKPKADPTAICLAVEDARRAGFFGANVLAVVEGFGWSPTAGKTVLERHSTAGVAIRSAITQHLPAVPDLWTPVIEAYHSGRKFVADTFTAGIAGRPMSRAYLTGDTLDRFTELVCEKAGTKNDDELVAFRNVCLGMLQHLGAVHWVAEMVPIPADAQPGGVRDTAFNPEWVKWPVYDLLWLDRSARLRPGVVPTDTINTLLGPHPAYAKGKDLYRELPFAAADRRRVLDLLKECKLAFDTVGGVGLLVPDLLDTAELDDPIPSGAWEYGAPFLPERVFLRFVAEVHRTLTGADDRCHRIRVVMTLAGHRVVIEARYSPPGHTRPSLSIRSESKSTCPRLSHWLSATSSTGCSRTRGSTRLTTLVNRSACGDQLGLPTMCSCTTSGSRRAIGRSRSTNSPLCTTEWTWQPLGTSPGGTGGKNKKVYSNCAS